jgi:hypothetical protein
VKRPEKARGSYCQLGAGEGGAQIDSVCGGVRVYLSDGFLFGRQEVGESNIAAISARLRRGADGNAVVELPVYLGGADRRCGNEAGQVAGLCAFCCQRNSWRGQRRRPSTCGQQCWSAALAAGAAPRSGDGARREGPEGRGARRSCSDRKCWPRDDPELGGDAAPAIVAKHNSGEESCADAWIVVVAIAPLAAVHEQKG